MLALISLLWAACIGYGAKFTFNGWNPNSSRDRVAFMSAMTATALLVPPQWTPLLLLGLFRAPRALWSFTALTVAINTALVGFLAGEATWWRWSNEGAWLGAVGAFRISGILLWNGVALRGAEQGWFLDALRLPARLQVYVGAVWIAMAGLKQDFQGLVAVQDIEGSWPKTRVAQWRATSALLPTLLFRSHDRASARKDALTLAGYHTPSWFAPFVAITALAAAGRLALVALPNIALTYVFVFLGGLLYGWRVGALSAAAAMIGTNVFLSGLAPQSFVNVPAMMLVGAAGGLMRGVNFHGAGGKMMAASTGFFATLAFSIVADSLSWALIPEFRGSLDLLKVRVVAGLAFNVLPAVANGFLFALVAGKAQETHQ